LQKHVRITVFVLSSSFCNILLFSKQGTVFALVHKALRGISWKDHEKVEYFTQWNRRRFPNAKFTGDIARAFLWSLEEDLEISLTSYEALANFSIPSFPKCLKLNCSTWIRRYRNIALICGLSNWLFTLCLCKEYFILNVLLLLVANSDIFLKNWSF